MLHRLSKIDVITASMLTKVASNNPICNSQIQIVTWPSRLLAVSSKTSPIISRALAKDLEKNYNIVRLTFFFFSLYGTARKLLVSNTCTMPAKLAKQLGYRTCALCQASKTTRSLELRNTQRLSPRVQDPPTRPSQGFKVAQCGVKSCSL